jgi:hypothetical protein
VKESPAQIPFLILVLQANIGRIGGGLQITDIADMILQGFESIVERMPEKYSIPQLCFSDCLLHSNTF